jgi:hypothetical protein
MSEPTPGLCDNCREWRPDVIDWLFAGREWLLICRDCREPSSSDQRLTNVRGEEYNQGMKNTPDPEFITALRACENVEKVTYLRGSIQRVIVVFPRTHGGRSTMTVPAAKALLARLQAKAQA